VDPNKTKLKKHRFYIKCHLDFTDFESNLTRKKQLPL